MIYILSIEKFTGESILEFTDKLKTDWDCLEYLVEIKWKKGLNVFKVDISMQEAVIAPRFHHQWLPDEITIELNSFDKELVSNLKKKKIFNQWKK